MGIFTKVERGIAIALLVLMGIVVISSVLEAAWVICNDLFGPPGFFLDAKSIDPMTVFSIAALVIALSGGYYFIKKTNAPRDG